MAEIIKLDEYLEKHRYNMLKATVDALGMDPENPEHIEEIKSVFDQMSVGLSSNELHYLETALVEALEAHDIEKIQSLLGLDKIEATWENDSMDYVDIAEGYNFRCLMQSPSSRNSLMDWLEENGYEYLIDNDSRFAVKCPDRKSHYHISRQVEHFSNTWDRPDAGSIVDPIEKKSSLKEPNRPVLGEAAIDNIFKDTTHHQSPFSSETRDDDEDDNDELDEIARKFSELDEKRKSSKQREKEVKDKLSAMGSPESGIAAKGSYKNKQKAGAHTSKKGYNKKEERKKPIVSESFELSEDVIPIIRQWVVILHEEYNGDIDKITNHVYNFFVNSMEVEKKEAQFLTEGVIGCLADMPPLSRMKQLAGIKSDSLSPASNITTITIKPTQDPGTPMVQELPGVGEARDLMAKAFCVFDKLDAQQQEVFKKYMIDNLMGAHVNESVNENALVELKREGEPLDQKERITIAKMLNKHWRGLAMDIDSWIDRTSELEKVELVILLLKKVANKIGQGLV